MLWIFKYCFLHEYAEIANHWVMLGQSACLRGTGQTRNTQTRSVLSGSAGVSGSTASLALGGGDGQAESQEEEEGRKKCRKALGYGDSWGCSQRGTSFGVDWRRERTGEVLGQRNRGRVSKKNVLHSIPPLVSGTGRSVLQP